VSVSVANERVRLAANAFDRLSTALSTVGALSPFAALIYGANAAALTPVFSVVLPGVGFSRR